MLDLPDPFSPVMELKLSSLHHHIMSESLRARQRNRSCDIYTPSGDDCSHGIRLEALQRLSAKSTMAWQERARTSMMTSMTLIVAVPALSGVVSRRVEFRVVVVDIKTVRTRTHGIGVYLLSPRDDCLLPPSNAKPANTERRAGRTFSPSAAQRPTRTNSLQPLQVGETCAHVIGQSKAMLFL